MLQELFNEDCHMLDIETNGLSPIVNGMTSFALVKFNLFACDLRDVVKDFQHVRLNLSINTDMLRVPANKNAVYRNKHSINKAELNLPCFNNIIELTTATNSFIDSTLPLDKRHVFALHTEFDIAFLRGYYEDVSADFPFQHRNVWEIASMVRGMGLVYHGIRQEVQEGNQLDILNNHLHIENFQPHNAIYDCVEQILILRQAAINTQLF